MLYSQRYVVEALGVESGPEDRRALVRQVFQDYGHQFPQILAVKGRQMLVATTSATHVSAPADVSVAPTRALRL